MNYISVFDKCECHHREHVHGAKFGCHAQAKMRLKHYDYRGDYMLFCETCGKDAIASGTYVVTEQLNK